MATPGDCQSIEETILENAQLIGFENSGDSDLRCAIFVGESLRKATSNQEKELNQLRFLIQEKNETILKQKTLCPTFKALESLYSQPMSRLEKEILFYRQLNVDYLRKIRQLRTKLDDSAKDRECLFRILEDLKNCKGNSLSVESTNGHCLLCSCQGIKSSCVNNFNEEQHEAVTLEGRLEKELKITISRRKRIQKDLEIMNSKMDFLSKMVMEIEEEEKEKENVQEDEEEEEKEEEEEEKEEEKEKEE